MIARRFFQRDPLSCSRELIGCELVWNGCSGIIVETEAYSVRDDEASHAFSRPSTRRFIEKHRPGTAYVYLNYGVHWLLNVLVKGGVEDGFVLLRALEPRGGIPLMQERRGVTELRRLCSGPGRLSQALGVTGVDHGRDLCGQRDVGFRTRAAAGEVIDDVRIGISRSAHLPWRFLLRGSDCVSVEQGKGRPTIRRSLSLSRDAARPAPKGAR